MVLNKKYLFGVLFIFFWFNQDLSAINVVFQYPNEQNVCGQSLLIIKISNTLSQPLGPFNGSLKLNSLMDYDSISTNVTKNNFSQSGSILNLFLDTIISVGDSIFINIYLNSLSGCQTVNCSQLTQVVDTLTLNYNGFSNQFINQAFLKSPCISYNELEFINRIVSGTIGDTITRSFTIRNTGVGWFNGQIRVIDNYRTFIDIISITSSNDFIEMGSIFSSKTDDSTYIFHANYTNVKNDDSIVITEKVIVKKCIENNEGMSSIYIDWGCGNVVCQNINPYPITAQVLKDYIQPNIIISSNNIKQSNCIDTTTHHYYVIKNAGGKKAVNVQGAVSHFYPDLYSFIIPGSIKLSDTSGMFLKLFNYNYGFSDQNYIHSCIPTSPISGFQFSFAQLQSLDSFIVEMDVGSCCPSDDTSNMSLPFEKYYLAISYNNICGAPQPTAATSLLANTDLSWTQFYEPIVTDMTGDPVPARDTVTIEIENKSFTTDFYKLDIKNAIFQVALKLDSGLAYVDSSIYLNSIYGYPLYPYKVEKAIGGIVDGFQDTITIASFAFPDTFNLNKNFFFKYFKYSSIFFDIRSYCPAASRPTKFVQEIYLKTDTNCVNECKILLSSISDVIAVHCPGCITPGWVAYEFEALRTNFGERDNDNNRSPDFSIYTPPDLSKIKRNRFTIGDTVMTELKAFLQDGDPVTGKTQIQLENNGIESFKFKYNYLKTTISDGKIYDLNYIKVFITDVDKNFIVNGIDSVLLPKSTVMKISNVNDSLPDATFFYDLSIDTLKKYGLNIQYEYEAYDQIRVVSSFSILNPEDFYLNPIPGDLDPWKLFSENAYRVQKFANIIYLTGEKDSPFDVDIDAATITPTLLDSSMIYWCEAYGGAANWIGRTPQLSIVMPPQVYCESECNIHFEIRPGGEDLPNPFPFEYRDFIAIDSIQIYIPQGFSLSDSFLLNTVKEVSSGGVEFELCSFRSNNIKWDTTASLFTVYIDSSLIKPNQGSQCYLAHYRGDERLIFNLKFFLKSACSSPDTIVYYQIPKVYYTTFPEEKARLFSRMVNPPSISTVSSELSLTPVTNEFQLNSSRYCYPITLEVKSGLDTYNAFIKPLNLTKKLLADTLYNIDIQGEYFLQDPLGVFRLDTLKGFSLNKYSLCMNNQCSDNFQKDSIMLYYGYNCGEYPNDDFSNICNVDSVKYYFQPADLNIQSYLQSPSQIKNCDEFELTYAANITGLGKINNFLVNIIKEDLIGIYYKNGFIEFEGNTIKIPNQIIDGHIINLDSSINVLKPTGLVPGDNIKFHLSFYSNCLYDKTNFRFLIQAVTASCDTIYDDTLTFSPQTQIDYPVIETIPFSIKANQNTTNLGGDLELEVNFTNIGLEQTNNNRRFELELPEGFKFEKMLLGTGPIIITDSVLIWEQNQRIGPGQSITIKLNVSYPSNSNCDTVFGSSRLLQKFNSNCDDEVCLISSDSISYYILSTCTPCPPVLSISDTCKGTPIRNVLNWAQSNADFCFDKKVSYNIYFSKDNASNFTFLNSETDSNFVHGNLNSFDGCYYVTAVNLNKVESPISNIVCNKTCLDQFRCDDLYVTNLITKNNDSKNDYFIILGAYLKLKVEIFNRWGDRVYFSEDYKNDFNGEGLFEGLYYYSLSTENNSICKGWIQIIK